MERINSLTDEAPVRAISWRVITSTGAGPPALTRLMAEPEISTRWLASWARAIVDKPVRLAAHNARTAKACMLALNFIAMLRKRGRCRRHLRRAYPPI